MIKELWEGVKRLFTRDDISGVLGEKPVTTATMLDKIKEWQNALEGSAVWTDKYIKSLRIEQGICRELADIVLSEMEAKTTSDRLDGLFQSTLKNFNESFQYGLGLGSICIKPLGDGEAEFVTPDNFIIMGFSDNGRPNDVVFTHTKKKSSSYYTKLERHSIVNGYLEITNSVYYSAVKNRIGYKVDMSNVTEWADLLEYAGYPDMKDLDIGFYRNPLKNTIDGSDCGVSIFDGALEIIERADRQAARIEWEFESGERAIHVDSRALRSGVGKTQMPHLNKRLYRGLEQDIGNGLVEEYSPAFREQNLIAGLERYYRQIEFIVGLSYGDLSDTQVTDKTAEEIKNSKKRKYDRVAAIQENLKTCLKDYLKALAFHEGLQTDGYDLICTFKDSILSDETKERQSDREDVAMGVMSLAEYRAKWYGETLEEAQNNIPEQATAILDNLAIPK